MGEPTPSPARWIRRIVDTRAKPISGRVHRTLLLASFAVFLGAVAWVVHSQPGLLKGLTWWPIVISFTIAVPATFVLKAFEFDLAARILGHRPSFLVSFEIAVLSAAANLLPVPGGVIVTVRALSERGASYGQALTSSAGVGIAWLGVSGILGGGAIVIAGSTIVGSLAMTLGALALFGSWIAIRSQAEPGHAPRLFAAVLVLEIGFVVVDALRLLLILVALDIDASITQTVALTLANSLSVALGVFPGGLGVRELFIAALSTLVGLSADQGLLVGVMDRVLWLGVMAVLTLAVLLARRIARRRSAGIREASP